jgi:2-keto-4-pentenoate hydratase/2-oxohepta-3-ene-1,7-dioic acid hydratase in catechol pathway
MSDVGGLRLVTYRHDGGWRPGLLDAGGVRDTAAVAAAAGLPLDCSSNRRVLEAGRDVLAELAGHASRVEAAALDAVTLGPPVPDPQKIICLGLNYRDHAQETGAEPPAAPILFAKYPSSLVGHGTPIVRPAISDEVDYEAELAVVLGRRCRLVAEEDALSYLAGAMPFNDVSARDLQFQTSQWTAGKAIDTFAPCGPALVTLDAIPDLQDLRIRARVNGETLQDGTTADMIFGVAATIAHLSRLMTLEPGDIVATGTPAGVGFTRDPKVLLRAGDRVEVEIEGLGVLVNPVVDA